MNRRGYRYICPENKICPTRVGMNRPERNRALPKRWHLPHTRGDEPRQLPLILSTVPHLPHTRGDEPVNKPKIIQTNFYICPTRVGMNRAICGMLGNTQAICPTRVGMNRAYLAGCRCTIAICPTRVGMNRSSARYTTADRAHLPHTRGDEPKGK